MPSSFIIEVQSVYNQLTKAEKKVATYIMKHPQDVLYMSITELADACELGDTSVYRFCRSVGLQGYQEFKMRLSLSLAPDQTVVFETGEENSFSARAKRRMNQYMKSLAETIHLIDEQQLMRVVKKMERAKRVYFFGTGNSNLSALVARNKFNRITNKVQCITDIDVQMMLSNIMSERDLLVIVSYSGETQENIDIAKNAKNSGAMVACITRYKKSPLTTYVDVCLLCGGNENPDIGGDIEISVCQMYIIDMLFEEYYKRNYISAKEKGIKTKNAIMDKIY